MMGDDAAERMFNHPSTPSATPAAAKAPAASAADRIYNNPTSGPSATAPAVVVKATAPQNNPVKKPAPAAGPSLADGSDGGNETGKPDAAKADAADDGEVDNNESDSDAGGDPLDGFEFDADSELVEELRETANDLGITKVGMARLVAIENKNRSAYWERQTDEWVGELKREPDFAGMGERARGVIRKYGDAGFGQSIGVYGNHPGLVKMLNRIAKDMEDR